MWKSLVNLAGLRVVELTKLQKKFLLLWEKPIFFFGFKLCNTWQFLLELVPVMAKRVIEPR